MEGVIFPFDLLVLLELKDLVPLDVVLNFWVEDLELGELLAVEVVVSSGETHFVLVEEEP